MDRYRRYRKSKSIVLSNYDSYIAVCTTPNPDWYGILKRNKTYTTK